MKKQYMMPAMQELDVTLKTAIMSGEINNDNPTPSQEHTTAPSRLYR